MVSKRGWQLEFTFALVLGLVLSILAVWNEASCWQTVGKEALTSRYVGIMPNGYCCKQAAYVECSLCLANPTCTAGGTSKSYCNNSQNKSSAECVTADKMFCSSQGFVQGNTSGRSCTLTGNKVKCGAPPNTVQCEVATAVNIQISYTGCGATVDACTTQPDPSCTIP